MKSFTVVAVAFALIVACAQAQSIDECLQQDSISCVQKSLFRKAREFFDKDNFEIVAGVSLVKAEGKERASRSGKDLVYEQEIDQASSVADRQSALENFVGEEVGDFFSGRSLRVSLVMDILLLLLFFFLLYSTYFFFFDNVVQLRRKTSVWDVLLCDATVLKFYRLF